MLKRTNENFILHAAYVSATLLSRGEWSEDVPISAYILLLLVFLLFHSVRPMPGTYCWNYESFRQLVVQPVWGVDLPRGLCLTQDSTNTEKKQTLMHIAAHDGIIRTVADTTLHRPHVVLLRWWNYGVYRELDMWRVRGNRNTRAILVRKFVGKRPLVQIERETSVVLKCLLSWEAVRILVWLNWVGG
jgi:hypothetical protein